MPIIISLYDYTGEAVRPWAEQGYMCYCYDIQHPSDPHPNEDQVESVGKGLITYLHADLYNPYYYEDIYRTMKDQDVHMVLGFPVCTDMAVSGAAWFKAKAEVDPDFQEKAVSHAVAVAALAKRLDVPYMVENPVSVLATKWRKPDHTFHPYEYGGYIPYGEEQHPTWPDFIAPRDAYPKKTCLWTGNGFVMPPKVPVEPETGHSRQHLKLGGKSAKTKNIRSATPRGFAIAVMAANTNKETTNGNQDATRYAVQDTDLLVS
jgi:hypothetical protein